MNQMDPGFSNTHFYKWGWFVAVELTQSKAIRPPSMDRESRGGTAGVGKQSHNPAASVGRLYILPTVLPWKSTKCRFSYQFPWMRHGNLQKNHQNLMRHMKRLSGDFIKVFSMVGSWTFVNFISMVCWQKWEETAIFRPNWKIHP